MVAIWKSQKSRKESDDMLNIQLGMEENHYEI